MSPTTEKWKTIHSFPNFQISNKGRVRRTSDHQLYSMWQDITGHCCVSLRHNGWQTTHRVSRLVGAAFCPKYHPSLRPQYRNGNRQDCRPANLRWVPVSAVTVAPAGARQGRSKLTEEQVVSILRNHHKQPLASIAKSYGVAQGTISNIVSRKTWRFVKP